MQFFSSSMSVLSDGRKRGLSAWLTLNDRLLQMLLVWEQNQPWSSGFSMSFWIHQETKRQESQWRKKITLRWFWKRIKFVMTCLMYILVGAPAEFESLSLNWCLASISYPGKASPTPSPHPFELHWLFWTEAILTFYLVQWTRLLFKNSGWGVAVLTALMPPSPNPECTSSCVRPNT